MATLISIIFVIVLDRYLLTTFQIVETYARGEVIYVADIFSVTTNGIRFPEENNSPILRIIYFIIQNSIFFIKISFLKLSIYILYVKPYYSAIHNISIISIIYPLYFFTAWFFVNSKNPSKAFITVFVLQAAIVSATSEDWDSRHIIPLLPIFITFGGAGAYHYFKIKLQKIPTPSAPVAP